MCGQAQVGRNSLLNPTVVVEIVSPETESYDGGRKFEHYRTIESLREHVLVAQDRVRVDVYTGQTDGRWLLTSASSIEETVDLTSIDCKISIGELYKRIQFEGEPPLQS